MIDLIIIQTDAQAIQGLTIMGVLFIIILIANFWIKDEQEKEIHNLKNKIKLGSIDKDDLYKAIELEDKELLNEIQQVLADRDRETYFESLERVSEITDENGNSRLEVYTDEDNVEKTKEALRKKYESEGYEIEIKVTHVKKERSRRISQDVKDNVWRRDEGKCVECGSNENLEFDHIIPHSKGGANTYRNIQLLCENCNRSKSNKIG